MNFFQFAQSSKSKPPSNSFASSPSSFIQFPTIAKEETKPEIEKNTESKDINSASDAQSISASDKSARSPFIFNPKKVTFTNPENTKSSEPSIKLNSILLSQSNQIRSDVSPDVQLKNQNDEIEYNEEIEINNEDITSDNLDEQMARLDIDFKLISSWSQKQMSALQHLQEEINLSSLSGNELLAKVNTILNS